MLLSMYAATAFACSIAPPDPFAIVADPADSAPPAAPVVAWLDIRRGHGPDGPCGGPQAVTSCDDIGVVSIGFDDPGEPVGYAANLVAGALPAGVGLPSIDAPVTRLDWTWIDDATDDQEAVSFAVDLVAVDAAGNASAPTRLTIDDPGSIADDPCPEGCGTAPLPAGAAALLVVGAVARRRRG
ncbi:MAG: hypothetical protein ABMB14_24605 [Myxococcota bacterium]